MRDSYKDFIKGFGINYNDFLEWGINNTLYPPEAETDKFWLELKERIDNGKEVYIRGYGRNGKGNEIITDFYSYINIKIKIDPINNMKPTQNFQKLTGLKKKNNIINYQVSHIFGQTKNVYMFEAPWNICFVPKIFDPLTGHEALGQLPNDYKEKWIKAIKIKYKKYIDDYNSIMYTKCFQDKIEDFIKSPHISAKYPYNEREKFKNNMLAEFSLIEL